MAPATGGTRISRQEAGVSPAARPVLSPRLQPTVPRRCRAPRAGRPGPLEPWPPVREYSREIWAEGGGAPRTKVGACRARTAARQPLESLPHPPTPAPQPPARPWLGAHQTGPDAGPPPPRGRPWGGMAVVLLQARSVLPPEHSPCSLGAGTSFCRPCIFSHLRQAD